MSEIKQGTDTQDKYTLYEKIGRLGQWTTDHELNDKNYREQCEKRFINLEEFVKRANKFIFYGYFFGIVLVLLYLTLEPGKLTYLIGVIWKIIVR